MQRRDPWGGRCKASCGMVPDRFFRTRIVAFSIEEVAFSIEGVVDDVPFRKRILKIFVLSTNSGRSSIPRNSLYRERNPPRPNRSAPTYTYQGETLDRMILDLTRAAWSHGQTYVPLSRTRRRADTARSMFIAEEFAGYCDSVRVFFPAVLICKSRFVLSLFCRKVFPILHDQRG